MQNLRDNTNSVFTKRDECCAFWIRECVNWIATGLCATHTLLHAIQTPHLQPTGTTVRQSTDTLLVGSGINSLVCAAMLAKQGHKVHVLEREAVLGGCIRTEALTAPGYLHDTLSAAHPLFVSGPAYAALGNDLHPAGQS